MGKKAQMNPADRKPSPEFLGHVWGGIFLAIVVILTVLLVGKGCFGG